MTIQRGQKYRILEFPNIDSQSLHIVKVRRIFNNPLQGTIVEYRHNWPFPIDDFATLKDFESWVATEL